MTNGPLVALVDSVKEHESVLHLMGLLSDGGVHSSLQHLLTLIQTTVALGITKIRIHGFLDGRDVPPQSALGYIQEVLDFIAALSVEETGPLDIKFGSLMGRYYAMDRDKRWDRVEKAYRALVEATPKSELSALSAVEASYISEVTDEFMVPVSFEDQGMQDGDGVVFFNFRPDRAREITRALVDPDFDGFERDVWPQVDFLCMTEYDPTIPAPIAFPKEFPEAVLADVVSDEGLRQFHIAETEKYAHVTFFLNGGIEEPKTGEIRQLIPSPGVATYDLKPEMSAYEVTATLKEAIEGDAAELYIVNYANCDMVGHTGIMEAAVAAVEAVDTCVGVIIDAMEAKDGICFVTADHGNADKMADESGKPHTAHTTALVPFVYVDQEPGSRTLTDEIGALADIAPTILDALGVPRPPEMTGKSLFRQ